MPSGHRPQPPVHSCRLAISGTRSTYPWTNVFYLELTDDGTQTSADLKTVIDAVMSSYNTNIIPQFPSTVQVSGAQAVWITGVGTALEYASSPSYTGTLSGTDVADNSLACVINWSINQYYRGGHPRTYHTGNTTTGVVNGSQVTAAHQSALAAAYTAWMNAVNALTATHISTVQLGTVSFARGNSWRSPPVFYKYQAAGVRQFLGTQRRRIGGR